ncbi:MAG: 2-oxoacid:acceptor oxidoreductase subunit alpha, partial [Pseudomonadota bacterium]|nr:2-oxoacid:acceptor oxidoreductase subunit alpha [Pseudomonadota bacterium]
IVLSDLDIGMNDWMCPDLTWKDKSQPDRGKVLRKADLEKLEQFYRYLDSDRDAIASRTLPGDDPKGAYFTRGSGHNMYGQYTEDADEYQQVVDRLLQKWETAKEYVPAPIVEYSKKNSIGIITVGSCDEPVREAIDLLAREGLGLNYLRIKAFPFHKDIQSFIDSHEKVFIIEQNRDAQLCSLIKLELNINEDRVREILHYNGLPLNAEFVVDAINQDLDEGVAA